MSTHRGMDRNMQDVNTKGYFSMLERSKAMIFEENAPGDNYLKLVKSVSK